MKKSRKKPLDGGVFVVQAKVGNYLTLEDDMNKAFEKEPSVLYF